MDPQYGTAWVERYIQDAKRIDPTAHFDGAACHHYRNFPENPDLDSDIAAFLAMLDRNGCGSWPFYINEGGCYPPFNIPEESISPYVWNSANPWYFGPLSYHSGRSERISAAFSARNWLVALKYQSRVACMEDFMTPSRYTDIDFTSRFYEKIPNTLGRLLGNASFYRDIRFASYVRCYVFKDDTTGSPIAALWGYKETVDRWQESPPLYKFDFGGLDLKFIDLMENEVAYPQDCDGRTIIPLSPFPLFIKGMPGTEDQLCDAIAANGNNGGGKSFVIMNATQHNGTFTASTYGFWYNTPAAVPAGWVETAQNMYTTSTGFVQCGSNAEAVNNTGETVHAGQVFTVSADLGGGDGTDATVRIYATQNSDGTGNKVLLASVHRLGLAGDGYTLFHVIGSPGITAPASVDGYFVQIKIGGPYSDYGHYLSGYYDNIVVTSQPAPVVTTVIMDANHHNGSLTYTVTPNTINGNFWNYTSDAIPAGWTLVNGYVYSSGYTGRGKGEIQLGTNARALNNTGEIIHAGQQFMVTADLGQPGADPTVRLYATQNPDGTGTKVLLASVDRVFPDSGVVDYNLVTVMGAPGSPAPSSVEGYYGQVVLDAYGYYDNIVAAVVTYGPESICCGDAEHPYPIGDLNQDCYVNWQDMDKFAGQWLVSCAGPNWCSGADLGKDAGVNLNDLAAIVANWLFCTDPNSPCSYNP